MSLATVTRWWWIRHAPVTGHGDRIYGQDDLPADCSDSVPFAVLAEQLPADAVWVTSQLRRAQQTAAALHAALRIRAGAAGGEPAAMLVEPDFAEQHFGEWQGLTRDELHRQRDGEWHRFWLAPAHEAPPGGESFAQVVERVAVAMRRLTVAHRGRDIIAIAHGGSIRGALALALGLDPERALAFVIDNCSLTRLDHIDDGRDGGWRVTAVNASPGIAIRR